jgi:D-psicose/D-tagatose/L-ribulose 3-epimerase
MKTAISNIAWNLPDDERVAGWMKEHGVGGVEIAPTKIWPKPLDATVDQLVSYRRWWEQRGIPIVAMQALLFGRADLAIFETQAKRDETLAYLERIMAIGSVLGAGPLVFGSPKNRKTNGLPAEDVEAIAVEFFRRAGDLALRHHVTLCIEPNPTQYDCDWVTCAQHGIELVRKVDHPGFRLHLDAAGMHLAGDDIDGCLQQARDVMCHFHVSEPNLGLIGRGGVQHESLATELRAIRYSGFASVEMRYDPEAEWELGMTSALRVLAEVYQ